MLYLSDIVGWLELIYYYQDTLNPTIFDYAIGTWMMAAMASYLDSSGTHSNFRHSISVRLESS